MFRKILIANRGEIAARVIRTARRLGIATVAVYSDADAGSLPVELADEACRIGEAPAQDSYLDGARIIAAALETGAEAIHPGYGFLSENADFAEACAAAGVVFIGPSSSAIRAMGGKAEAKALMEAAGVPVVPGYHGAAQDVPLLAAEAQRVGYPVLVKASAGGGGRGMRIVTDPAHLADALASARREAQSGFGDGRLIIEKYLERPRHIEVQIFGDRHGNIVHLFERDCSTQRRHQKIVEEAPASGLDEAQRAALGATAVAAARAVGYVGAGTVEFVAEDDRFYFIEMNTRLQVEHPVTEMITGLDLVEWQLRVAAGEPLPLAQDDIARSGHAVEARLYAEDPAHDFLPATGMLAQFRLPAPDPDLRIETGLRTGDAVTVHYDPLLAKLVAWGEDRATALRRLGAALAGTGVAGLATNRDFLLRLVRHPDFAAGAVFTGFIAHHHPALLPAPAPAPVAALAAASLVLLDEEADLAASLAARSGDPHSPWQRRDGWRLAGDAAREIVWRDGIEERVVRVDFGAGSPGLTIAGRRHEARLSGGPDERVLTLDGMRRDVAVAGQGDERTVILADLTCRLSLVDPREARHGAELAAGGLTAPMPGKVLEVLVVPGSHVLRGARLMVLEAMKMEHAILAPGDGEIASVHYAAGDLVAEGALLLAFVAST